MEVALYDTVIHLRDLGGYGCASLGMVSVYNTMLSRNLSLLALVLAFISSGLASQQCRVGRTDELDATKTCSLEGCATVQLPHSHYKKKMCVEEISKHRKFSFLMRYN
uniref:Secreted protein n=1 Tax=Steinernema glaseri TaxID=37863 RepID=A0A1I8AFK6_9BILA